MYTLYYMPGSCSMAVHVILNELNQPVTLENVAGDTRPPAFLKINPRGSVPVLVDGSTVIREGAAIITYLCEKHNSSLLPRTGKEHASALEWLMFCNATLHPAFGRTFFALKNFSGEVKETVIKAYIVQINKLLADVESHLSESPYLAGKDLTAADILLTVIANWTPRFEGQIVIGPNTKKLLKEVVARPSYQKALTTEKVEYKAAA